MSLPSLKVTVFFYFSVFNMASFRGQKKPGPHPDWSPLGDFRQASLPLLYGSLSPGAYVHNFYLKFKFIDFFPRREKVDEPVLMTEAF